MFDYLLILVIKYLIKKNLEKNIAMLMENKTDSIFMWFVLIIVSIIVFGSFINTKIDGYERAMFDEMIIGRAHKPFVYRCFIPVLTKGTYYILPEQIKHSLNILSEKKHFVSPYFFLTAIFWYLSILGFAFSLKKLAQFIYNLKEFISLTIAIIGVAGIPIFFKYYSYIYDLPQLFLFTLSLYFLVKARWNFYLLALFLSTMNKETSILLIFVFFIHYKNILSNSLFRRLLKYQFLIFISVTLLIRLYFYNNPGTLVEFQLFHNLSLEPYSVSQFISFIIIGIAIYFDWENKPHFLRSAFYMIIPLLLLTLFLGFIDEYRDYYEVYPVIILLVFHSIQKLFHGQKNYL